MLLLTFTDKKVRNDQHEHKLKLEPIGYCGCWIRESCVIPGCNYERERPCNKNERKKAGFRY